MVTFQDSYLPPTNRERLRQEFQDLKQLNLSVAEFEAVFSSLSRFALELVATEERCCIEFEKKLKTKIMFKLVGNMIREYDPLVETTTHEEISIQAEEKSFQSSRSRGQESQGDYRQNKKSRVPFHPSPNHSSLDLLFPCLVRAGKRMHRVIFRVSSVAS